MPGWKSAAYAGPPPTTSARAATPEFVATLNRAGPFGAGNPKPVFATKDLLLVDEPYVMKEKHLKMRLADALRPPESEQ